MSELIEETIDNVRNGKQLSDGVGKQIVDRYLFAGKTIAQWRDEFHVAIPTDPSPAQVRELLSVVADKYQEANYQRSMAEAKHIALSNAHTQTTQRVMIQKRDEVLVSGNRAPGKDILEALSLQDPAVRELTSALANSEIETTFWKGIISSLDVCRKSLETASMTLGIEAKVVMYQGGGNRNSGDGL